MNETDPFSRGQAVQRVEDWSVVGADKLAGTVFNRPGHRDGGTIVTSSVVQVRIMGTGEWPGIYPVAFTASGSTYRLGKPSAAFGVERAERFIRSLMENHATAAGATRRASFDPSATIVKAAVDTSLQNFERIELYATSFHPL